MSQLPLVRPATATDAPACAEIYAPYVTDTCISFEAEPPVPLSSARESPTHKESHEWLVAERDAAIVGYAYAHGFHIRAAYRWSCETSIYLAMDRRSEGIGRALYEVLLARLTERGYRRAFACIALPNHASIGLHRAFGFEDAGSFRRVGWKYGAWHDVAWLQRTCNLMKSTHRHPSWLRCLSNQRIGA